MSKPLKLPKDIQIGARVYKIQDLRDYAHDDNYGDTDHEKQIIHIYQLDEENPQKERQELDTVLHEICHAGCASYAAQLSFAQEERMVNLFARMCADLFINNPDMLRYLNEACKRIRRKR